MIGSGLTSGRIQQDSTRKPEAFFSPTPIQEPRFVSTCGNTAHTSCSHGENDIGDIAILSIDAPTSGPADIITPKVTVLNYYDTDASFPLNLCITSDPEEYNQTQNITLGGHAEIQILFPDWTPEVWQTIENTSISYTAVATALVPSDWEKTENTLTENFSMWYGSFHDINLSCILSPAYDTLAQTLPVKIQIQNTGQYPEQDFFVHAQIQNLADDTLEYDESNGVTDWIQPGETLDLVYPDWIPANLSLGISGVIPYQTTGTILFTTDENTNNDVATASFNLTCLHDVCIKAITSPGNQKQDDTYLHFDDGTNQNAIGLSKYYGDFQEAIRLTPTELHDYAGQTIDSLHLHYGYEGMRASTHVEAFVKIYDADTATNPGPLLLNQTMAVPPNPCWMDVTLTTPILINGSKDIWVAIHWYTDAGDYPAGCDGGPYVPRKGDWTNLNGYWIEMGVFGFNLNWNLWAHVTTNNGIPVYVGAGDQAISCIVKNLGTFPEHNLMCTAQIFGPGGENGSLYYQDSVGGISLAPLGGEQNLSFADCTFLEEGPYLLTMNLTLNTDDNMTNNHKNRSLICDLTPPVSTISLPPPDGNHGWYRTQPPISISAYDNLSGVASIWIQIDGGVVEPYTAIPPLTDGNHTIGYFAVDRVGNSETEKFIKIKIDRWMPSIVCNTDVLFNRVKYTAVVSDVTSGMDRVEFWIGPFLQYTQYFTDPYGEQSAVWILSPNPHIIKNVTGKAYDIAGNVALGEWSFLNLPSGQSLPATPQTLRQTLH